MVCYGQVEFFALVTLKAHSTFGLQKDISNIVAMVRICKTTGEDASKVPVWYKDGDLGGIRALDVATIESVVGRVRVGKKWGIIDRSYGFQQAIMHGMEEVEYESEDDADV